MDFIITNYVIIVTVLLLLFVAVLVYYLENKPNTTDYNGWSWFQVSKEIKHLLNEHLSQYDQELVRKLTEKIKDNDLIVSKDFLIELSDLISKKRKRGQPGFYGRVEDLVAKSIIKQSKNKKETKKTNKDIEVSKKYSLAPRNVPNDFIDLRESISKINYSHPLLDDSKELLGILSESHKSPLLITVLGEFSSGKSTFINALLKEKLLAMKIRPTTATITKLQFGKQKQMTVHRMDGNIEKHSVENLNKFTVETHIEDDKSLDDIFYVQLEIDNEFLNNIDLADTPGFNSTIERHTEITTDFIRHSDVVIWLFSAEQMLKKSEIETLEKYCKNFKPIVIINQIDKLGFDNREQVLKELDTPIKKLQGIVEKIFPVSSKLALNGVNGEFEKSGMQNVFDYFKTDIIPHAKDTKAKMTIIKLLEIAENLQTIRLEIDSKIKTNKKQILQYKKKKETYEKFLSQWNDIIDCWNEDWKNDNVSYDWMINHLNRYFGITSPSSSLKDSKSDLLSSFKILCRENTKIDEEYKRLESLITELDVLFEKYERKWNIYDNKVFGLKSFMDSVLGDVSEEKIKLNKLAAKYNNKHAGYNDSVDYYNKHINSVDQQWSKLNERMNHFLNNDVLREINSQFSFIDNLSVELENEKPNVKKIEKTYKIYTNQLNVLENEVVSSFKKLYSSLESNLESRNGEFDDFESMLIEFNSYSAKHSEINWKDLYTRNQLNAVVIKHKEKESAHSVNAEQIDKDTREAKEV